MGFTFTITKSSSMTVPPTLIPIYYYFEKMNSDLKAKKRYDEIRTSFLH